MGRRKKSNGLKIGIASFRLEDAVGNKITIQNGVLQDRMKISNNVGV